MTTESNKNSATPTVHHPLTIENFYELWGWHSTARHPAELLIYIGMSFFMVLVTAAERSLMIFMWVAALLLGLYGIVALNISWRKFINANCHPDASIMQVMADRKEILRRLEEEADERKDKADT